MAPSHDRPARHAALSDPLGGSLRGTDHLAVFVTPCRATSRTVGRSSGSVKSAVDQALTSSKSRPYVDHHVPQLPVNHAALSAARATAPPEATLFPASLATSSSCDLTEPRAAAASTAPRDPRPHVARARPSRQPASLTRWAAQDPEPVGTVVPPASELLFRPPALKFALVRSRALPVRTHG